MRKLVYDGEFDMWFEDNEQTNMTMTVTLPEIGRMNKLVLLPDEPKHAAPLNVAPLYDTPDSESLLQTVIRTILGRSWS